MNTRADMHDCEDRTDEGYPLMRGSSTRPRARVECAPGGAITSSTLDQRTDNSQGKTVNQALPWFVLVASIAAAALALAIDARADRTKEISDAVLVAKAEMRAEFADRLAQVSAEARQAGDDAAIWKNRVNKLEAEINANRRR